MEEEVIITEEWIADLLTKKPLMKNLNIDGYPHIYEYGVEGGPVHKKGMLGFKVGATQGAWALYDENLKDGFDTIMVDHPDDKQCKIPIAQFKTKDYALQEIKEKIDNL